MWTLEDVRAEPLILTEDTNKSPRSKLRGDDNQTLEICTGNDGTIQRNSNLLFQIANTDGQEHPVIGIFARITPSVAVGTVVAEGNIDQTK